MHLALWEGRLDDCLAHCAGAAAATTDPAEYFPHTVRALALTYAGRAEDAQAAVAALRPVADRLGNPSLHANLAYAMAEIKAGSDPRDAIAWCEQADRFAAPVRNQMLLGVANVTLASLHARHGGAEQALRAFRPVVNHLYQGSDWTHLWTGLRSLVELLNRIGGHEPAAVLHDAVTGAVTAPPVYGNDAARLREVAGALARVLGKRELGSAQEQGRSMDDHTVVAYALAALNSALGAERNERRS